MRRKRKKKSASTEALGTESLTPEQAAKNVSALALLIDLDVRNVMASSLVTYFAGRWFLQLTEGERATRFRTHPANNMIYQGLEALEERSVVAISEVMKDENKLFPHAMEILNKQNIKFHRHALSHPVTVKWDDPKMQDFDDAGRKYSDFRPAQIWNLQCTLNQELKRFGLATRNESIPVSYDMAAALHMILDLSRQPEVTVPSAEMLFTYLQEQVPKYQAFLEKHPDGARDLQKENERREHNRAMWTRLSEKWAKQREEAKAKEQGIEGAHPAPAAGPLGGGTSQ